jgi:hypothetical protein
MLHDLIVNTLIVTSLGVLLFLLVLFFRAMVDLQDYKNCDYNLEAYKAYIDRRNKRGYLGALFTHDKYLQTFDDLANEAAEEYEEKYLERLEDYRYEHEDIK